MGNLKFNIDDTCGDCYSICPVGAVKMSKREPDKEQSLERVEPLIGHLIVLSFVQSKTKIRTLEY